MTQRFVVLFVLTFGALAGAQIADNAKPLAAFVGHWEGSGHFQTSPLSVAGDIKSVADCGWSAQQHYLICEQTLTDDKGSHQQLTIYAPSDDGHDFTYYTIAGTREPFTGKVLIEGNTWTYDSSFEQDGKHMRVRTVNTFTGDDEAFKTEYSVDGSPLSTMLDGRSHRTTTSAPVLSH